MLNRDFKEFVASFNAHAVEYRVVGGNTLLVLLGHFLPIDNSLTESEKCGAVIRAGI